jgi:CheY-like chemotaxis protein
VGLLAGGIAHDFNNQLTVIKGYCDLLLRGGRRSRALRGAIEEIRNAARRATVLTSQLLTFSRQQVLRPQSVDLNELLAGLAGPLATMIGEDIRLSIVPEQALGHVLVDRTQVEQAIMNLAVNSRDAMPRGGQLAIETANVTLDEGYVGRHVDAAVGPHVMLAVTDTGVGMDAQTLSRIFDPFFTTKPVGKGTGLGLPMVYGFVKQSGGHITVSSEPGKGSTFRIYLPRVEAAPGSAEAPPASVLPRGREIILVAEDSEPLRQLIVRVLRECGYAVLEAPTSHEALPLAADGGRLDLLVTDIVMPDMSGPELAGQIKRVRPDVRVLYITGYAPNAVLPQGLDPSEANLLAKPFTPAALAQAVRRTLDGKA